MLQRTVQALGSAGKANVRLLICTNAGALMADASVYPPPDAARGATADLCDVHLPDPVDKIAQRKVQIMDPIFR